MEKTNIINPFVISQPAIGNDFFGREDALRRVKYFLHQDNKLHFFIFGTRRIGKTSLLKNISERFTTSQQKVIYLNMQEHTELSVAKILQNLEKKIVRLVEKSSDLQIDKEYKIFRDDNFLFALAPKIQAERLVLLIDEFDVLVNQSCETESDFIDYLSKLTRNSPNFNSNIKMIYAVGRNYSETGIELMKKFKDSALLYNLEEFDVETVRSITKLSEHSIPFDTQAVQKLYEYTSGNPYFTQCLAYTAFNSAESLNLATVTDKIISRQFISTVKSYGSGALVIWNEMHPKDRLFLFIASHASKNRQISHSDFDKTALELNLNVSELSYNQSLERLTKNNFLIQSKPDTFEFKIEFFRKWISIDVRKKEIKSYVKQFSEKRNLDSI